MPAFTSAAAAAAAAILAVCLVACVPHAAALPWGTSMSQQHQQHQQQQLNSPALFFQHLMTMARADTAGAPGARRLHGGHSHSDSDNCTAALQYGIEAFQANRAAVDACNTLFGATHAGGCKNNITDSPLYFRSATEASTACGGQCLPLLTEVLRNVSDAGCSGDEYLRTLCTVDADCGTSMSPNWVCRQGTCLRECAATTDCACGESCTSGVCETDEGALFPHSTPGHNYATLSLVCAEDPEFGSGWCFPIANGARIESGACSVPLPSLCSRCDVVACCLLLVACCLLLVACCFLQPPRATRPLCSTPAASAT